jgi:hypothetical protein
MLWELGALHEAEVIRSLDVPFLDLSTVGPDQRMAAPLGGDGAQRAAHL